MQQRLKQVLYGKATLGYRLRGTTWVVVPRPPYNYLSLVPRAQRNPEQEDLFPTTPRVHEPHSKRAWDAAIRRWRRALHVWDSYPVHLLYNSPPPPVWSGGGDCQKKETNAPCVWHLIIALPLHPSPVAATNTTNKEDRRHRKQKERFFLVHNPYNL